MNRIFRSLVALALIAGCSESLSPEDFYAVWGGDGARLTLSSTQARFETSCWAGDMAIPILVDGEQFTAIGNIHSQGGAGGTESRAVILNGRLDGDVLQLTVETSFQLGPYRLQRDAQVQIPGCP
ncbi:MAG TPA: hypothetical protein VFD64_20890 [Gemmatimonadaceae bacterium]|nr:hypothetical protein [Gemmatimonadaceae bacterium]